MTISFVSTPASLLTVARTAASLGMAAALAGCMSDAAERDATSEAMLTSDIVSMAARTDGKFDVVCRGKNGTPNYNQIVTSADIAQQRVCTSRGLVEVRDGITVKNVNSPYADPSRVYLLSRDLASLRRQQVLSAVDESIIERLSTLRATMRGWEAPFKMLELETLRLADDPAIANGLLPAEQARLSYLWNLFTIEATASSEPVTWPVIKTTTRTTDPLPKKLDGFAAVSLTAFPAAMRPTLERARQYGSSASDTITWEAIHAAVTTGPFTTAEIAQLTTALDQVTTQLNPAIPTFETTFDDSDVTVRESSVGSAHVTARSRPRIEMRRGQWECGASQSTSTEYVTTVPPGDALFLLAPYRTPATSATGRGTGDGRAGPARRQ